MITITIPVQKILDDVNSKTYYIGESYKKKDADFCDVQTSEDNADELISYIETSVNEIVGNLTKRVNDISFEVTDDITISFNPFNRLPGNYEVVAKMLDKAIEDYVANYTTSQWLNTVKPEIVAAIFSLLDKNMSQINKYIGMLSGMVLRRATDLGGI